MTNKIQKLLSVFFVLMGIFIAYHAIFTFSYSYDPNYKNVTVDTRVNITNSPPRVINVTIDEAINGIDNLTLLAGRLRTVYCNATVRDWDGWNDVNRTNATFWDANTANMDDPLNNNSVYRNTSCTNEGNDGAYVSYWSCTMDLLYYANNGSDWRCNVTAIDNYNFTHSNFNTTEISPLYALNISNTTIDYGEVAVEDYTQNVSVSIYNFGNMNINTSVWGYAKSYGDDLAFNCSIAGNISIGNERYTVNASQAWADMTNLTSSPVDMGFTIPKQTDAENVTSNTTYWQVYIPVENGVPPGGLCTGSVVFEARAP